jgi:hypothetical protein
LDTFINIADWNFFLKRWWVYWKLWKLQSRHQPAVAGPVIKLMTTQEDEDREKLHKLVEEKEVM